MKSIKSIVILGIIISIIDAAVIVVLKIAGNLSAEMFNEALTKSLSIIGVVFVAVLVIALILNSINSNQGK